MGEDQRSGSDQGATDHAAGSSEERLFQEMQDRIRYLERQVEEEREARRRADTLLARLIERVPEIEVASETPGSPESSDGEAELPEPRPAPLEPQEATERPPQQRNGWRAPVDKLPWWHYVLGLVLVGLASYFSSLLVSNFLPSSVFGLWVGFRRKHPRFRSQIIPFGILVGLAIALGDVATSPLREWVSAYERFSVADFAVYLAGYMTSTILAGWLFYVSGALVGSAWQRRRTEGQSGTTPASPMPRANQASPRSRTASWSPRQQAILGFAGTIIAALISLMGTIFSAIVAIGG